MAIQSITAYKTTKGELFEKSIDAQTKEAFDRYEDRLRALCEDMPEHITKTGMIEFLIQRSSLLAGILTSHPEIHKGG